MNILASLPTTRGGARPPLFSAVDSVELGEGAHLNGPFLPLGGRKIDRVTAQSLHHRFDADDRAGSDQAYDAQLTVLGGHGQLDDAASNRVDRPRGIALVT